MAGTPVLASAVVVADDVMPVPVEDVAVAAAFVDVPVVERAAVLTVPLPDNVARAVVVTADVVVGRVAVDGRTDPLGRGRLAVVVGGAVVDVTGTKMFTIEEVQVTVEPPAVDPLHWLIVTGSAADDVEGVTVHRTRIVPPPLLAEPLHWVISALVVLPIGLQSTVG